MKVENDNDPTEIKNDEESAKDNQGDQEKPKEESQITNTNQDIKGEKELL